jgi:uncharacterized protein (TIGR03435 family)
VDVYDGFESPTLSDLWDTSLSVPGAITLESAVVRSGHGAIRVDLNSHDKFSLGKDGDPDTERDEIREAHGLDSREDTPYEYSWSMYLPPDFPIVPDRLVVAQWKQNCLSRAAYVAHVQQLAGDQAAQAAQSGRVPCDNDSPPLAIRYIGGVLQVTRSLGDTKFPLWEDKRDLRGHWVDFRVQAHFTPQPTGRVKVWVDGKQVVDYTGVTANPESPAGGYLSPSLYFFKFGLYRDVMAQPMTAYFDEYHKRKLPNDEPSSPIIAPSAAHGQRDTSPKQLAYDVVSIKPNPPGTYSRWHRMTADGLSMNVSLKTLIFTACSILTDSQISGLPEWAGSRQFDVEAKMDADTAASLAKLPQDEQNNQRMLMLQALLADRFGLKVHHETRKLPVYTLVIAKGGLKMHKTLPNERAGVGFGRGQFTGRGITIGGLATFLSGTLGQPVVDKTGLTGQYDAKLKWTPDDAAGSSQATGTPLDSAPSFFRAVQEELGLKLVPSKEPVDAIVVDHLEAPSEN